MAMFNGKGPDYCKNCGGDKHIHRADDNACPNRGKDQTGLNPPLWLTSTFTPQDWEKEEPADMARLPLNQEIKMEEHTLFDDYYIAAIRGVSAIFSGNIPSDRKGAKIAAEALAFFAQELAVEAIKNRALYLYGEYKE